MHMPPPMPEGPCVAVPALSLRQPFASLVLYGVKQLEARNRPALKQLIGTASAMSRPAELSTHGNPTSPHMRQGPRLIAREVIWRCSRACGIVACAPWRLEL